MAGLVPVALAVALLAGGPPTEVAQRALSHRQDLIALAGGPSLVVACASEKGVRLTDANGKSTGAITLAGVVRQLTPTPTGWAALLMDDTVVFADGRGTIVRTVPLPRMTARIAVSAAGKLAAMAPADGEIDLFEAGGALPSRKVDGPDASTRLHMLDWFGDRVVQLSYLSVSIGDFSLKARSVIPTDAVAGTKALFVSEWAAKVIRRSDGKALVAVSKPFDLSPWQMAVRADDSALVVAQVSIDTRQQATRLSWLDGRTLKVVASEAFASIPRGVAIHPTEQRIYICNAAGKVDVVEP
ncbi:MAG: DNA-binding beta-propeller fold protein YncE [Myxococcota bacterium]